MNLFELFEAYYDKAWERGDDTKLDRMEAIFRENGLDETFGDTYECFEALSTREQKRVVEVLTPDLEPGDPGYARSLYEAALSSDGQDPYDAGVLDFYEALKAEGVDLGF